MGKGDGDKDRGNHSVKPYTVMVMRHAGSHLIKPLMRRLTGQALYSPKGDDALIRDPSGKVVVFLRDPRDRAVSGYRYKAGRRGQDVSDVGLARFLSRKPKGGITPIEFMQAWGQRWNNYPGAMVMRFEDLVRDAAERKAQVDRLAGYVGCGDPADAIAYAFETSRTFTGRYSSWPEWFGPLATKAWHDGGGARAVKAMGYK